MSLWNNVMSSHWSMSNLKILENCGKFCPPSSRSRRHYKSKQTWLKICYLLVPLYGSLLHSFYEYELRGDFIQKTRLCVDLWIMRMLLARFITFNHSGTWITITLHSFFLFRCRRTAFIILASFSVQPISRARRKSVLQRSRKNYGCIVSVHIPA